MAYEHLNVHNVAPAGSKRIAVYDEIGRRRGIIPLGSLTPPDRSKRLYSFGALSDPHVNEKPYGATSVSYDNFIAGLKCLQADEDVKFVLNGGDLIVWTTVPEEMETHLKKYSELVQEHLHKDMFAVAGNHEMMYLRRTIETDGESQNDFYIARWLNHYAGWANDPDSGAIDLVKTVFLNDRGEVDPEGNDVLVLMSCYMYQVARLGHECTRSGLLFENVNGTTTITDPDSEFSWNVEWLGETEANKGQTIEGYTVHLSSGENSIGAFVVDNAVGNVLNLKGTVASSGVTDEVKIWSEFTPQSQLYPARDIDGRPTVRFGKYGEIGELFDKLKAQGKRIFVLQHVPVTSSYPENATNPTNVYWLYKSLFYGTTVFSGHTHYEFEYPAGQIPQHSVNTYAGFNSVHIPSVYDHAQGYIVDVYEDGIHLRGKKFKTINGEAVSEDVPLGTYWIATETKEE